MKNWQRRAVSVDAMRDLARSVLPRAVFDFADGGAETETTLRRNEAAMREIALLPRPLRGAATRDTSITLFGHRLSMPLMVGPTGLAGLFWPGGECCTARAAHQAGVGVCLSHGSVATLEEVAETGATPRWMQVFIYKDRGFTRELTERAKAAGYHALVLTIDNQLLGNRERDVRNGFTIPPRPGFAGIADTLTRAEWLWRMRRELPKITFGNYVRPGEPVNAAALAGKMGGMLDPGMSWRDVDDLRRLWDGPLILKGVMHPDDAAEAVRRGVDGIIVSNHGGRQLDGAAAPIEVLPAIAEAAAGAIPVLVDGGVRRGGDIVKALALGATACLVGRPQLWGLAVAGEAGVSRVLEIYRTEFDRAIGLCGFTTVADIDRTVLMQPPALAATPRSHPMREIAE